MSGSMNTTSCSSKQAAGAQNHKSVPDKNLLEQFEDSCSLTATDRPCKISEQFSGPQDESTGASFVTGTLPDPQFQLTKEQSAESNHEMLSESAQPRESQGHHLHLSKSIEHQSQSLGQHLGSAGDAHAGTVPSSLSSVDSGFRSRSLASDLSSTADCPEGMPRNFSWVVEGLLCACAFPDSSAKLGYLADQGVTHIVSLTAERALPEEDVTDFDVVRLGVLDMHPPSLDHIITFVDTVQHAKQLDKKVAVHCAAGRGRTGTVIACYLICAEQLAASEAIMKIRQLRPGSVETPEQEEMVHVFEKYWRSQRSRTPLYALLIDCPVEIE